MKMNHLQIISACTLAIGTTLAADCPPPEGAVDPIVKVGIDFDASAKLYRYRYEVKNGPNAELNIEWFGLVIGDEPADSKAPAHWHEKGSFRSADSTSPSDFVWSTSELLPELRGKNSPVLPEPSYTIKKGASLIGFEITTPRPPGPVMFTSEGFTPPIKSRPTATDDEPIPQCPGWDFDGAQILSHFTGLTTGPLDENTVAVRLRARDEKGKGECPAIRPKTPSGKISVLVLSTKSFDASQVDPASVLFGPGYAKPLSSVLVPSGEGERIGKSDEREEWERDQEKHGGEKDERGAGLPKNLLLTFDVASLDVQCRLDHALFLRGKTKSGVNIVGAVSAKIAGCGKNDFGVHRTKKVPKWGAEPSKH